MEELLGNKFINSKLIEVNLEEVLRGKVIALLFTAGWCSPCCIFEKELIEHYNEINIGEKMLEIIHISFDKSEDSFRKSINGKPWVIIPHNDKKNKELCDKFGILTIPMFLVLKSDGSLLTDQGRKEISEDGLKVIDRWLEQ